MLSPVRAHTRTVNYKEVPVREYVRNTREQQKIQQAPVKLNYTMHTDFNGAQNYWYTNQNKDVWIYDPKLDIVYIVKGVVNDRIVTNKGEFTKDTWNDTLAIGAYEKY